MCVCVCVSQLKEELGAAAAAALGDASDGGEKIWGFSLPPPFCFHSRQVCSCVLTAASLSSVEPPSFHTLCEGPLWGSPQPTYRQIDI